ncbi:MAG TPA: sodium:solute symporter family protein [Vicinamibacterales bacterium]|jgi:SSS family solute:Na+ symporter
MHFTLVDWLIVGFYLAVVFVAGTRGQRYVRNSSSFLVAGRTMGIHVGMISLVATEIGIITYMYYAEMGVLYGFAAFMAGLIPAGIYVLVGSTGFVISRFRELELVTISEFFDKRYGRDVRVLAGVLMAVGGALNFGVFPIIEAKFLNIVTGVPPGYIVWTMVLLMTMVLIYTALGGMISVVVTNYVQYAVLAAAMIIITGYCLFGVGLGPMVATVEQRMGQSGFDPFAHKVLGWPFLCWQCLSWLALVTAWAPIASRTFSSEDTRTVRRVFFWTGFLSLGRAILPFLWGIAALTYLGARKVPAIEALPVFLSEVLPVGVAGLVLAGMLAASMSTYSGYLLAWSSVISQDVVMPLAGPRLKAKHELLINRLTVLCLTVFIIGWGLFYVVPGATYFYLQITGNLFLAGTFWTVVAGMYWKGAHRLGAYCSLLLGASATLIYFVVDDPVGWTGTIGMVSYGAALVGMVAGSVIGRRVPSTAGRVAWLTALGSAAGLAGLASMHPTGPHGWLYAWIATLAISLGLFVVISVWALVRGYGDMRRMFRRLDDEAAVATQER